MRRGFVITIAMLICLPLKSCDQGADYLVITPDDLFEAALELKEHRQESGHKVLVVPFSAISLDPSHISAGEIDAFIEDYHEANPDLEYIALIGSNAILPPDSVYYPTWNKYISSDLIYAVKGPIEEENYLRNLKVGRIPVKSPQELRDYVDKIKRFEGTFASRNTILFFGHEPEIAYAARDAVLAKLLGYYVIIRVAPTADELYQVLNSHKIAIVMYYGHGTPLQNLPLYIGNLDQWQNDKFPVLYISGGCNFRDSLPTVRSLSEELLIRTNGASSAFGSSGGGGYGYDYYFSLGVMKTLFKPCTVGELLNNASRIMYNRAVDEQQDVGIGSFTYYAMHRISLTGDPAISLKPLSEFE